MSPSRSRARARTSCSPAMATTASSSTAPACCNAAGSACAGACPVNNWLNVVTIRFHVLARNVDASSGYADGKVYELGIDDNGAPVMLMPGGPYRRHVFSSLVRIANASGRRDRP